MTPVALSSSRPSEAMQASERRRRSFVCSRLDARYSVRTSNVQRVGGDRGNRTVTFLPIGLQPNGAGGTFAPTPSIAENCFP